MKLNITTKIIIGFIIGIIVGQIMHTQLSFEQIADVSKNIKLLGDIFLRSIHLIVGPLIFCTLSVGVAKLGDFRLVGRIGLKTLAYFYFATILSLLVGLVFVNITRPGEFGTWKLPASGIETGVTAKPLKTFRDFLFEIFPDNIFQVFAENKAEYNVSEPLDIWTDGIFEENYFEDGITNLCDNDDEPKFAVILEFVNY